MPRWNGTDSQRAQKPYRQEESYVTKDGKLKKGPSPDAKAAKAKEAKANADALKKIPRPKQVDKGTSRGSGNVRKKTKGL